MKKYVTMLAIIFCLTTASSQVYEWEFEGEVLGLAQFYTKDDGAIIILEFIDGVSDTIYGSKQYEFLFSKKSENSEILTLFAYDKENDMCEMFTISSNKLILSGSKSILTFNYLREN